MSCSPRFPAPYLHSWMTHCSETQSKGDRTIKKTDEYIDTFLLFLHKEFRKHQTLRGGSLLVLILVLVQILVLLGVLVPSPSLFTTVR